MSNNQSSQYVSVEVRRIIGTGGYNLQHRRNITDYDTYVPFLFYRRYEYRDVISIRLIALPL